MDKGKIEILNYKKDRTVGALCIMHSKGAILGNPYYKMAYFSPKKRIESIEKFRRYLWIELHKDGNVRKEISRLAIAYLQGKHIRLYCCCKPLPCHGDIIKKAIIWLSNEIKTKRKKF